jgi:hypothetical protein
MDPQILPPEFRSNCLKKLLMGKEVTNLKPATIFAFCCRVCSQIVFTISGFDSWSASGSCWGLKADSHIACRANAVPLPCHAA